MPTNFNIPSSGQINLNNYIGATDPATPEEFFNSILQTGGYQEVPTEAEKSEIPVSTTPVGTGINGNVSDDVDNQNAGYVDLTHREGSSPNDSNRIMLVVFGD